MPVGDNDQENRVSADPSAWRALAFDSYAGVRDELNRLKALDDHPPSTEGAEQALSEALQAMEPKRRRKLKLFYSGANIEAAWRAIHRARAALYMLYQPSELKAQAEHIEVLTAALPEQSALQKAATALVAQVTHAQTVPAAPPPVALPTSPLQSSRAALRGLYEQAMEVTDGLQREARMLRNSLMTASIGIFLVVVALGVAHAVDTGIIKLCTAKHACPIGSSPHPFDVFAIELAGMLGGLLSVVIPLATGERIKTPYRVFNQQLLLKTLAGAAAALAGILLVEGALVSAIKLESTSAILGYAVFFGFSQQVVTGFVDRRADALAKQTPSTKSA